MQRRLFVIPGLLMLLALPLGISDIFGRVPGGGNAPYEVWVIDQSDTTPDGGGTLYIYQGNALNGRNAANAIPEVIDLGGAARSLCLSQTGSAPRRPHMLMFNSHHAQSGDHGHGGAQTHAILTFVATGHVLFIEAASRNPVACIDAGAQAHAATPSPDQSYVIVANQNGKLLQRIETNYATNSFTLDPAATLDLANCTTPNGAPCQDAALRPDNAPICPIVDSSSRFSFVTLRGGGLFVIDNSATPLAIVAEYDRNTVHPNGCGGVELAGNMYINAGGGTPANPLEADLYAFSLRGYSAVPNPPNHPGSKLVFSHDERGFVDSHGTIPTGRGRYLWLADRAANHIVVVDIAKSSVAGEIELTGKLSADPAPDLLDISPAGNRVFVTLRGPSPLTGNAPGVNNAVGATPGLGVLQVEANGKRGRLLAIVPISHIVNGVELADPHGLAVRRTR